MFALFRIKKVKSFSWCLHRLIQVDLFHLWPGLTSGAFPQISGISLPPGGLKIERKKIENKSYDYAFLRLLKNNLRTNRRFSLRFQGLFSSQMHPNTNFGPSKPAPVHPRVCVLQENRLCNIPTLYLHNLWDYTNYLWISCHTLTPNCCQKCCILVQQ